MKTKRTHIRDLNARDPFIVADTQESKYFLCSNQKINEDGSKHV